MQILSRVEEDHLSYPIVICTEFSRNHDFHKKKRRGNINYLLETLYFKSDCSHLNTLRTDCIYRYAFCFLQMDPVKLLQPEEAPCVNGSAIIR